MRTHADIHATNPFAGLLTDDAPFTLIRDVFAWTHRMEALGAAQDALARADELFGESHAALRERLAHARRLRQWDRVSRVTTPLPKGSGFSG
jgi:hypothetical protein